MIIVVSHQKGGVGKSTIAWNLATNLQKNYQVELVDLDIQKTLTYTNEIRKQNKKLKPLTIKSFSTPEDLKEYIQGDNDERLSIIDVGGFDSSMNRLALVLADMIITPVSDKSFELLGIKTFEKIIEQLNDLVDHEVKVKVLLNNLNPKKSKLDSLKGFINKSPRFELLDTVLRSRADYDKSVGVGKNVIEFDKDSKASKEIKDLTKELKRILKLY
jgi:chromosome partitioning protein